MAVLVLHWLTIRIRLLGQAFFDDEYVVDLYVVEPRSKTKAPIKGHMFVPHLVKVRCMTKSSNKGHIFGHIWSESAAWQSPLTRGTFWATFGRSPLHDKVLQWGVHFGPHLVEVCWVTKSSNEGHILGHIWSKSTAWQSPPMMGTFWATFGWSLLRDKVLQWGAHFRPHLVKVCSETKSSDEGHHCFCHIWPLSTAWQLHPMANHGYRFLATLDQSPLCHTFSFLC
jgi:hypothetical protein